MNKKAILVIDMQIGYAEIIGKNNNYNYDKDFLKALNIQKSLINHTRKKNFPLIIMEYFVKDRGETFEELSSLITSENDLIIEKNNFSAFYGTRNHKNNYKKRGRFTEVSLDHHLNKLNINELIIGGFHTDKCVAETIEDGLMKNYTIYTSPDILVPRGPIDRTFYEIHFNSNLRENLIWHNSVEDLIKEATK